MAGRVLILATLILLRYKTFFLFTSTYGLRKYFVIVIYYFFFESASTYLNAELNAIVHIKKEGDIVLPL